jgi:glycosyltransferase involved in cell wall biosynthesis
MKAVLYVSANGFIGGAEKVVLILAQMHASKKENAYFLLFNDGPLKDEIAKLGFHPYVLKNKFKLRSFYSLFKAIQEIRELIKDWDYSIIHSTMAYSHLVMGLATPFSKKKKIWFQHGPVGGILDILASFFPMDIILFNSSYLLKKHMGGQTLFKGKFAPKVIPLPINLEEPKYSEVLILENKYQASGQFVVGSFGRIARGKNYDLLIKAFANIKIEKSLLFILGSPNSRSDEIYYKELKKLTHDLNIVNKVHFIPHQTNVNVYYKLLNCYVHPGILDEGFGLTVAEAMFLGTPVISSDYGALRDFVKNDETALVIKSRDRHAVDLLTSILLKSLSNEIERKKMSNLAQNNIKTKYNFSNFQVAITDVYQFLNSID